MEGWARRKRSWRIVNWLAGQLQLRLTHHYNHDGDDDDDDDEDDDDFDNDDNDGDSNDTDNDNVEDLVRDKYWCEALKLKTVK